MDIASWLQGLGLTQYEQAFRDNHIDADVLGRLMPDDLRELGVASIGHRRRPRLQSVRCRPRRLHRRLPRPMLAHNPRVSGAN